MLELLYSQQFIRERKKFTKKSVQRVNSVDKCLKLFTHNPQHPSLRIEKLVGTDIWTIRVDIANRIFFIWQNTSRALLLDIGRHDKYRQY